MNHNGILLIEVKVNIVTDFTVFSTDGFRLYFLHLTDWSSSLVFSAEKLVLCYSDFITSFSYIDLRRIGL